MTTTFKWLRGFIGLMPMLLSLLILTSLTQGLAATSPTQPIGPIKGFKIGEPYGPPNERQTKSLIEGGTALLMPGGKTILSDGVTLRTFSETNAPELVVRVKECVYSAATHSVDSAGPIQMETADGKFTIEGTGFFWQQTNSSLIISNHVHTTIQAELLQSTSTNRSESLSGADTGPLYISSGRFSYDGPSGRGVWNDNVRVTGTNLTLNSEVLTAMVPSNERERKVRSLLAETNVAVKYTGIRATGDRLNYAPDTGLVRVSDHATWQAEQQAEQRDGGGDELVIDRTNRIFQVNGHAWLHLPGQALGESGFLSMSNAPARKSGSPAEGSVDISCDHYEIRTNWATFTDQVRLEEHQDQRVRGRLTCQAMMVTFGGSNELQTVVADKNVVIEEEKKRFTGGRAFYTHTNTTLEMTQNPEWKDDLRSGKGDLLRLNTQQYELFAAGNASLRLHVNELAGQLLTGPQTGTTNRAARSGTNQFAEIFCDRYTLRPDTSVFQGGVYATHPEMNWSCEKLTVQLPTTGTTNLVAEQNVVFEFMTQKGTVQGKGDDAVYSFGVVNTTTNGNRVINELRLSGTPAILSSTNGSFENHLIIWDRASGKISLPGSDYKIQGFAKAMDTNIFMLPNKKLRK